MVLRGGPIASRAHEMRQADLIGGWADKSVNGTFMTQAFITLRTVKGQLLYVHYDAANPFAVVSEHAAATNSPGRTAATTVDVGHPIVHGDAKVLATAEPTNEPPVKLTIQTSTWTVELSPHTYTAMGSPDKKSRLDVSIRTG